MPFGGITKQFVGHTRQGKLYQKMIQLIITPAPKLS